MANPRKRKLGVDTVPANPFADTRRQLLKTRVKLPIWARQKDIQDAVKKHDVLVLSGETGSGKSTQIPQFLAEQEWCTGKIAITQPRRVAAINLARRVAHEVGTPCGRSSPASTVGYSVRFDDATGPSTVIKYLTEGMLLQEMLRDSNLSQYSCVIVDEVHERSVNVDLLLGFLKGLLTSGRRKKPLKVVVMSATADVEALSAFFSPSDRDTIPETSRGMAQAITVVKDSDKSDRPADGHERRGADKSQHLIKQASRMHVEGRQYPVTLHYLPQPTEDIYESAVHRILSIHCKEPMPGDMLVFMTGQESIQKLQKMVEELAENLTAEFPKLLVLPLFAALPQSEQQRIFEPVHYRTRKVILSTNVAETSVTVPGVRFVVDTGKAKIKQFRNRLGLDSLLIKPISRSSADQRKGRAGREAAGQCFRLYTQASYHELEKETKPEILRSDLSQAVLNLKARGVDDVLTFPFLTPPPRAAMENALLQTLQLGALDESGNITAVGRQMARLPLTPRLGRVVVEAAAAACLPQVIDIVACLSEENIFLPTDGDEARDSALTARQHLMRRQGDHLTLLATVQAYAAENADRRRWAADHLVSHRAMQNVMGVRKQLRAQCATLLPAPNGDAPSSAEAEDSSAALPSEAQADAILKTFLRGFLANVARLCPDGSYKTFVGNHTIAIHPSSVLFGRKVEAIMYNEFVFTNKAYARGVSAVQLRWAEEIFEEMEAR